MIAIVLDTDWAPAFVVEEVAALLIKRRLKANWFVAGDYPPDSSLRSPLFELGIHPLFANGGVQDVIKAALVTVPGAKISRSHGLMQSTPILTALIKTGIEWDVSLHIPEVMLENPCTFSWHGKSLLRVFTCWDDSFEINANTPAFDPHFHLTRKGRIKVFAFHPIHIYMNTRSLNDYLRFRERIRNAKPEDLPRFEGKGVRTAFLKLLDRLDETVWISDLRGE